MKCNKLVQLGKLHATLQRMQESISGKAAGTPHRLAAGAEHHGIAFMQRPQKSSARHLWDRVAGWEESKQYLHTDRWHGAGPCALQADEAGPLCCVAFFNPLTFRKPDQAAMSRRKGGTNSADATSVEGRTPGRRSLKEAVMGRNPAPVG